jgi:type IV pilus assembly protein PilB
MFARTDQPENSSAGPKIQPGKPVRIGDLLLEKGLISQEQIAQALDYQRNRGHKKLLGEILIELELVTQEQVSETLAEAYDVPFARISPKVTDPKVIEMLPREFLEKHLVLPLFYVQGKLTIAVSEPTNVFLIEEIARLCDCPIQIVAATLKDIQLTLEAHLPNTNIFVIDDIVEGQDPNSMELVDAKMADMHSLEAAADDSPIIKLVNYIIFTAVEEGASDIHIEPDDNTFRVRIRIDGKLFEKMRPPFNMLPAVVSRIKIMAGMDISERRVPQDGVITVMLNKHPIDLRVSTMPGKFGEKVVMRIVDNRNKIASLDTAGMDHDLLKAWKDILHRPNGIILVTGPTGSGKSTTLYGSLNELNDPTVNISTVEDPVENSVVGVNQFQTNDKAGFTFALALRALLRQDPDVVMVGEIRDPETAKIAVQAALTGHVVLSTLHTNDAPSAVTRLFNIGVEPYLVAAAIRGVLAQRLLRKICTRCKEPMSIDEHTMRTLKLIAGDTFKIDTIYQGTGCKACRNTGYSGRVGIFELYIPNDDAMEAIARGAGLQELKRIAKASGYRTLADDGLEKVKAGITTVEELFHAAAMH